MHGLLVAGKGSRILSMDPVNLPKSYQLHGLKVTPLPLSDLLNFCEASVRANRSAIVVSQNLHGVACYFEDSTFRDLHRIATVRIDGMSLVWLARGANLPIYAEHRITWVDLVWPLLRLAVSRGWKVYYLGGEEETLRKGLRTLSSTHPGLQVRGRSGFFNMDPKGWENEDVLRDIRDFSPEVLLVGMGMPRQERWIHRNLANLSVPLTMTCGALMEYVAGTVPTPPRWAGRLGLEWCFRLIASPGRFWKRYLFEPWIAVLHLMRNRGAGDWPTRDDA